MKTSEKLEAILCNPDSEIAIQCSQEDKNILYDCLDEIKAMEKYSKHRFKPSGVVINKDFCELCGEYFTHTMHIREVNNNLSP